MAEQQTEGTQAPAEEPASGEQAPQPIKFDEWIGTQDESIKTAYEEHTTGLKNTVTATRQERDTFAKQIKELSSKAEKGSDLEKLLNATKSDLEAAEKRAVFSEEAVKPEIGCSNPRAAFLLAAADDLFDRRGNPDWKAIKEAAPELFGKTNNTQTHAGTGAGTQPKPAGSMNDFIRQRGRK